MADEPGETMISVGGISETVAMLERVAEKAATSAAEKVSSELRVEMAHMENRIKEDISRQFESRMVAGLGMTTQEHIASHTRSDTLAQDNADLARAVKSKIGIVLLVLAALAAGRGDVIQKLIPALVPQDRHQTEVLYRHPGTSSNE